MGRPRRRKRGSDQRYVLHTNGDRMEATGEMQRQQRQRSDRVQQQTGDQRIRRSPGTREFKHYEPTSWFRDSFGHFIHRPKRWVCEVGLFRPVRNHILTGKFGETRDHPPHEEQARRESRSE